MEPRETELQTTAVAKRRFKRTHVILLSVMALILVVATVAMTLYLTSDYKAFTDLHREFSDRIAKLGDGSEVSEYEKTEFDDGSYVCTFTVALNLGMDDGFGADGDSFATQSGNVIVSYYSDEKAAESAEIKAASFYPFSFREGKVFIFFLDFGADGEDSDEEVFKNDLINDVIDSVFG